MSVAAITVADLRSIDLFDDLSDDELAPWLEVTRVEEIAPGDSIIDQGAPAPGLQLLLDGTARTFIFDGGRPEPLGRQEAPTWIGAIAVLTGGLTGVSMVAEVPCRLALVPADDFRRLALAQPAVHARVMAQVAPVMSRITGIEQSRERLASLGTMAAGLAHELNNPAAAARRAAAQMSDALKVMSATIGGFVEAGLSREAVGELVALQQAALARAEDASALDALDAADAEDALLDRLEELGISEPWRLTEPLIGAGLDAEWLDRVVAIAGDASDTALRWIAATLTARGLAGELCESTERMSRLVGAVKTYAYMDRGELVDVDLHEGLETTLVVLGHKLKHTSIQVVRDYDRELPRLTVHGSELNQVWTNLLDNAIDALGERGTITITTRSDGDCAVVKVTDDGPGIGPEAIDHVFDDFFTTKDVGLGTGLGLATARRIVVDRHGGSLTVESTTSPPSGTTFRVRLPFSQP